MMRMLETALSAQDWSRADGKRITGRTSRTGLRTALYALDVAQAGRRRRI
jgi:hypothetical protein